MFIFSTSGSGGVVVVVEAVLGLPTTRGGVVVVVVRVVRWCIQGES